MVRIAIILAAMVLSAAFDYGASAGSDVPKSTAVTPAENGHHFSGSADHVRIDSVVRVAGEEVQLVVTLTVDPGYHINANPASYPDLIPTTLTVIGSEPRQVIYPPSSRFKAKFADDAIDVYQGTVQIFAVFPNGTLAPNVRLHGTLLVQACTDQICLPPAEIDVAE